MKLSKDNLQINPGNIIADLILSISLEESAIAHLLEAEAVNIQAFTGTNGKFPTNPSNKEIVEYQRAVGRILEAINEKQKNLVRTIELTLDLLEENERWKDDNISI